MAKMDFVTNISIINRRCMKELGRLLCCESTVWQHRAQTEFGLNNRDAEMVRRMAESNRPIRMERFSPFAFFSFDEKSLACLCEKIHSTHVYEFVDHKMSREYEFALNALITELKTAYIQDKHHAAFMFGIKVEVLDEICKYSSESICESTLENRITLKPTEAFKAAFDNSKYSKVQAMRSISQYTSRTADFSGLQA